MNWNVRYIDYPGAFRKIEKEVMETVRSVLAAGDLIQRQQQRDFESHLAAFVGTRHAVGVSNCTDALELALRLLFGTALQYQLDPTLWYVPQPSQRGFPSKYYLAPATINADGLRGEALPPKQHHHVMVVGDSYAFGSGLRDDETFALKLQAALRARDPTAVVTNAGVPGYGLFQMVGLLERRIDQGAEPDVVLLFYGLDDILRQGASAATMRSYEWRQPLRYFTLWHFTKVVYIEAMARLGLRGYTLPTERGSRGVVESAGYAPLWPAEVGHFDALRAAAARSGARVALFIHAPKLTDENRPIKSALDGYAQRHHIPIFTKWLGADADDKYFVPRDRHYSALYYNEVIEEFRSAGFLDALY